MQRLPNSPMQFQFGVRGWAAVAVGALTIVAAAFLAVGFLVVVIPVALVGSILFRLFAKPRIIQAGMPPETPRGTAGVIEGDFKVIDRAGDSGAGA